MARFEVRVQLLDVRERNAFEARKVVEDRLRDAGFDQWRVLGLRPEGMPGQRRVRRRRHAAPRDQFVSGSIFIAAVIAWWMWFWLTLV